jgi:hypothetical protein
MAHGAIRTHYYLRIPNVGDAINPDLITAMSGRPTVWTGDFSEPHLLATGSILGFATPSSLVWGAGVLHARTNVDNVEGANIAALRGPLSAEVVRASGITLRDIPLGDPGILAPDLLGVRRSADPEHELGIVPHYVDRDNPSLNRLGAVGAHMLNVHDEPITFLQQMAKCAAIASTSLHGLIFAEALGIPNLWLKVGHEIAGNDFKFADWFATTEQPQRSPYLMDGSETPARIAARAILHGSTIDVHALKAAFPLARLDEVSAPVPLRERQRNAPTPVFLISHNRADWTRRCVAAVRALSRPTEIVVHDNGSVEEATIALLIELERAGVQVVRHVGVTDPGETIRAHFARWSEPVRYVVSDCTADISVARGDMLDVFDDLLNRHRTFDAVGPALRGRGGGEPNGSKQVRADAGEVSITEAIAETGFALHRAGEPFRGAKRALRVGEPFSVLWLDD